MNERLFDPPVFVKDGKYLIQEIVSVADAIDILDAWPAEEKDIVHEAVLRACHEASDGFKPISVARRAFEQFASKTGILADSRDIAPHHRTGAPLRRRISS